MIYVGIDPGLSGALAIITPNAIALWDAPVVETGKGRHYDLDALLALVPFPTADIMVNAAIEEVHAMPKQGVSSMFKMGYGLGLWHMALVTKGVPFRRIQPQAWKKEFGLLGTNKDAARLRAIEIFPQVKEDLKRKRDGGRADALLIAEYLRRVSCGLASKSSRTEPKKS